jgi:beta-barrel assembly-enhancing protease
MLKFVAIDWPVIIPKTKVKGFNLSLEQPQIQHYQSPESHERAIKKMVLYLCVFFTLLFILVGSIVAFADRLVVYLPFSAEKQFVRPYETLADNFFADEKSEPEALIQNYLQNLSNELAIASGLQADISLEIHFLESDAVNAFATLGGHIFVCRGLLEAMPDENSLAMVLAHEVAHIQHRDPAVGMTRGLALQLIYSFISGDYQHSSLTNYGSELGILYFSREQEKNADLAALKMLNIHYGHIGGFDKLFQIVDESRSDDESEATPHWLSSHPAISQRIELLNEIAQQNEWQEEKTTSIPDTVVHALAQLKELESSNSDNESASDSDSDSDKLSKQQNRHSLDQ